MDDKLLLALLHIPFLSLRNAALLLAVPHATVDRAASRLCRAGLIERVPVGYDKTMLYCLTDDGVIAAAHCCRHDPVTLATAYGLGHRPLLAQLPALARALDVQDTLVPLVHALLQTPDVEVVDYRLSPLRWAVGSHAPLLLDGQMMLDTPAGRQAVGLLWDGDVGVPDEVLYDHLWHLDELGRQGNIPVVLVVTHASERVPWPYPASIFWTTVTELWAHDPLHACWRLPTLWSLSMHDHPPAAKPLLAALAALLGEYPTWPPVVTRPCRVRPGQRLGLEARVSALRHGKVERRPVPPRLLALALPPRAIASLETVGRHPFLQAPQVAVVSGHTTGRTREALALLTAHGVVAPYECGEERTGRYVLTSRGLRLLAARVGLPVALYRTIYGVLEDAELGVRHGLEFAATNLAHTTALQEVFLAFVRAARSRGTTVSWRGEWACVRTFEWLGQERLLRPDAEVVYEDGRQSLHLFVELDRSTCPLGDIADQLTRYHRYAQILADQAMESLDRRAGRPTVMVAFVAAKSEERARNIIAVGNAVTTSEGRHMLATPKDQRVLDVRATSLTRLIRRGPLERIWWQTGQVGVSSLLVEAALGSDPESPYGVARG